MEASAVSDGNSAAPASFEAAFASDASSAPESSAQSSSPAAAVEQPTASSETTPAEGDERSAFIPRSRFDEVNTERSALKQWKEQYGWAESVNREQVELASRLAQLYQSDRAGFVRELIGDNPDPALVSEFARALSARRGQAQAAVDLNPIQIQMEDGRTLPFFTAEQIQSYAKQQVDQAITQIRQEMAPALTAAQQLQLNQIKDQANQFAEGLMGEMQALPGFQDNLTDIGVEVKRVLDQIPMDDPRRQSPGFLESVTYKAYTKVAVPKLSQKAQSQQLDELQRKATASVVPNPGSAVPTTQKPVNSFHDASLSWS